MSFPKLTASFEAASSLSRGEEMERFLIAARQIVSEYKDSQEYKSITTAAALEEWSSELKKVYDAQTMAIGNEELEKVCNSIFHFVQLICASAL